MQNCMYEIIDILNEIYYNKYIIGNCITKREKLSTMVK